MKNERFCLVHGKPSEHARHYIIIAIRPALFFPMYSSSLLKVCFLRSPLGLQGDYGWLLHENTDVWTRVLPLRSERLMSQMNWRHTGFCRCQGSYVLHHSCLSPMCICDMTSPTLENPTSDISKKAASVFQFPLLSSGDNSTYILWFP